MVLVIAHTLATAILMKVTGLRFSKEQALTYKELLICAVIGLLPDFDIFVQMLTQFLGYYPHRIFTHNIFIPLVILGLGWILHRFGKYRFSKFFFLGSLAYIVHILLDLIFLGPVWILAPFNWTMVGLTFVPDQMAFSIFASLDTIILFIYLASRVISTYKASESL